MSRPKKPPDALTAEDLRALGQLPQIVTALAKLAAQATTIQNLGSTLLLTATPAGGTALVGPPPKAVQATATRPVFRPPRSVPGVDERMPDFTPIGAPTPARLALQRKIEEIRGDPEREAKLAQFTGNSDASVAPEPPDEDFM